ncbi:MAG: mevalonate kinase [Candidatus Hadarchaeum sp.]|uniref:mevalonate kinase n=1 Tax=Candidatus Hadarchaeum sp. TaxID=2883567 RepID=UPI003D0E38C3
MGEGKGYGKVILINEHFVVYGIPSIVSAIEKATVARVEREEGSGWVLDDRRPATPGYKEEKLEQQRDSIERIIRAVGVDLSRTSIKITLEGDLVAASGIGASAASCVAIARALSEEFNLSLTDDQINQIAYEGEKAYHGNPSGVDNTAATYGGLLWFVRGKPIERISIRRPVEIVMANTGLVANTEAAVAGVRERRQKNPAKYERIFKEAEELAYIARKALVDYDLRTVGILMNRNHELLQAIEVSCKELDFLVELARENGAYGAKMTGGGLGGNMVALTPGRELQERVARAIRREGFEALVTRIG